MIGGLGSVVCLGAGCGHFPEEVVYVSVSGQDFFDSRRSDQEIIKKPGAGEGITINQIDVLCSLMPGGKIRGLSIF